MRIVIFGTGQIYCQQRKYLEPDKEIVVFIDNDSAKWNTYLDGVKIVSPKDVCGLEYDYIILMSMYAHEMKLQLYALGIPQEKIIHYEDFFHQFYPCKLIRYQLKGKDEREYDKKCLIICNRLGYHGGPMAAVNEAFALESVGIEAHILASDGDQEFIDEVTKKGLTILIYKNLLRAKWCEMSFLQEYTYIIVNTVPMINCAIEIAKHRSVLFWLHDAEVSYREVAYWNDEVRRGLHNSRMKVCAVSNVAKNIFREFYGYEEIEILPTGIADSYALFDKHQYDSRLQIMVIGSIFPLKGQDIFIESFLRLPRVEQIKTQVHIIGKIVDFQFYSEIKKMCTPSDYFLFYGEMSKEELDMMYNIMDILVVPSRQETMSLVAMEAMMYGKVCIVSEKVGIAEYIKNGKNGYLFTDEENLTDILHQCIFQRENLKLLGPEARKTYLKYFTVKECGKKISDILRETQIDK